MTSTDTTTSNVSYRESSARMTRDLLQAAKTMSTQQARYLVDSYYLMQDDRKRAHNQVRAMTEEPHSVVGWLAEQSEMLEHQIKRALDYYSDSRPAGLWAKSVYGIGPVIAAGLLAHIDINLSPTAGHIWRFAGLDPTSKWRKGERRPFNANLKVLTWKAGQSFMKFSNRDDCVYGHVYREAKAKYAARNDGGEYAEQAAQILTEKNFDKSTPTYAALKSGKLPPAQIDGRARRYAVKLFLSHLQCVWWFLEFKHLPAAPYAIAHQDHTHFIQIPNSESVPGLVDALRERGWWRPN